MENKNETCIGMITQVFKIVPLVYYESHKIKSLFGVHLFGSLWKTTWSNFQWVSTKISCDNEIYIIHHDDICQVSRGTKQINKYAPC